MRRITDAEEKKLKVGSYVWFTSMGGYSDIEYIGRISKIMPTPGTLIEYEVEDCKFASTFDKSSMFIQNITSNVLLGTAEEAINNKIKEHEEQIIKSTNEIRKLQKIKEDIAMNRFKMKL